MLIGRESRRLASDATWLSNDFGDFPRKRLNISQLTIMTDLFSSSLNHRASSEKSGIKGYETQSTRIVAIPSSTKSHLQLLHPRMPSIFAVALVRRPPNVLAVNIEHQQTVTRSWNSSLLYHELME